MHDIAKLLSSESFTPAALSAKDLSAMRDAAAGTQPWSPTLAEMLLRTMCGPTDDSQNVEAYDGSLGVTEDFVARHERAVGQLQWNADLAQRYRDPGEVSGMRWCTGTMISDDLFLTAGHCFDPERQFSPRYPRSNDTGQSIGTPEIARNMHVNFGYQFVEATEELRPVTEVRVAELIEYRLGRLDFAIVRLERPPGQVAAIATVAKRDANQGDQICIIGHPLGLPKRIASGPASDFLDTRIGYNTLDTEGGNSGSGILGPAGTVVGVHTNGGCTRDLRGFNYGHRIESLIAVSPTLKRLAV